MGWKIDRDYISGAGEQSRVGVHLGELAGETFRFRLLDDDGNVYYGGRFDEAATICADDAEVEDLYEALGWAMFDAGAVDLQVKFGDAIRLGLWSERFREGRADSDWVGIYA